MSQQTFLVRLVHQLESAAIPYMIVGSIASSIHGEMRATNDIDLVIHPTPEQLRQFVASLGDQYYVSPEAAEEALRNQGMFNVIDLATGWKADLILCKDHPYDREGFRRKQPHRLEGLTAQVIAPEDSILSKLVWAQKGGSDRQSKDALGVLMVQRERIDLAYLQKWASILQVVDALDALQVEADRLQQGR
jgi:hypothetical protein